MVPKAPIMKTGILLPPLPSVESLCVSSHNPPYFTEHKEAYISHFINMTNKNNMLTW
jgi:hypothetical protein